MKVGTISWRKFESLLTSVGCKFIKQEGDHRKYYKNGILRPIIIPRKMEGKAPSGSSPFPSS